MVNKGMTKGQKKILAATMPTADKYWRKQLEGAIPTKLLPDFYNLNNKCEADYHSASVKIDFKLCEKLIKTFGTTNNNIDNIFAMSIISLIFTAYNGVNEDILVQYNSNINNSLKVPLRVITDKNMTYGALFNNINTYVEFAKEYQKYPVDLLVDNVNLGINITTLEDYNQNYLNECSNLEFNFLLDKDKGFILKVIGDASCYLLDSIKDLANKIKMILKACAESGEQTLFNENLISENDNYIYSSLNSTYTAFSDEASLVDLFKQTFSKYPDKCAIIDNGKNITYSEFEEKAKRTAAFIRKVSKDEEAIVGILCDRSVDFLAGVYGILLAGKAYLPLDPKTPQTRNETVLKQSSTGIVIYEQKYEDKVPATVRGYSTVEINESNYVYEDINVKPDSLAYIIFTSGSTGMPKGVCVSQRSVVNRIEWMHRSFTLKDDDVILQKTPATFDVSVWELFWWAIIGGKVTLLPAGEEANPEVIIETIEKNAVTTMHFVPSMLNAFIDYVNSTHSLDRIKSLRSVFSSGEALSPNHVQKFYELFDSSKLINLYGPTEATVDVSCHVTKKGENPVPIGNPIDNIRLYIVDAKHNKRPVGMVGELCIAGVGVANGYINDEVRTKERFVAMPSLDEERVYLTGDLARIRHDKTFEFFGRNDRQVKIRGFRIELGEVEAAFTKQNYVSDVIVITNVGTDNIVHLLTYVILKDKSVSKEKIREDVSKLLPKYMVPDSITIIDAIPFTPNGKVNKKILLELNENDKNKDKILPSSKEEKIIAQIWQDVLGVDEVGINDNFFELGGNSINFVSVLALANEKGLKFTFQQLFKNPTIMDLLNSSSEEDVDEEDFKEIDNFELISAEDKAKMPDYVEDAYPMSMLQSGLVYQSTIMEGDNNYHDIVSYTIKGKINVDLFKIAVKRLVETQPIFRTSYSLSDFSEYLQIVHKKVENLPLNVYDLRGLKTDEEKEKMYQQWFWKEQHRPFNWSTPGLVQLHIHILSDDSYKYSISQHNSALDGWSMNKVHTFLFETYFRLLEGKDIYDKSLSSNNHNKTFIYLEQKAIKSEKFNKFWINVLKDVPDGKIPRARKTNKSKGNEVIFQDIKLPEGLSGQLIDLANSLKVPVKDILLASHIKFISLLTKKNDVFTGYEIGGRPELLGAEDALGVFLNTMPFRVILEKDSSWKELIQNVYNAEGKFLPYRRYPMAKAKEDVGNRGILFEIVFNFTHFYSLKKLRDLPGFDMIDVRAAAITEFPLRVEYSRHFYNDEVELSLHYQTAIYDEEDIKAFGEVFIEILESMVNKTNNKHSELDIDKYLAKFNIYSEEENSSIVNDNFEENALDQKLMDPEFSKTVEKIKSIWSSVLKIPKEKISLKDDFFLIGGNSLSALKASLFFQKKVTLKTLMKKSKLYELAEEVLNNNENQVQDTKILHCLTKATVSKINIIFLPYAGGNAINFMPIAKEIEELNADVSVFAAELPGHDANVKGKFTSFTETTKLLADEIQIKMKDKEIIIWGHCVGTSLALSVTNELEKRGTAPKKLYLAGKILTGPDEFLEKLERTKNVNFDAIRELYTEWSGSSEFSSLGEVYETNLTEIFKHDANESNQFLNSLWNENSNIKLNTPAVVVITKDDQITENYEENWKVWEKWINSIDLRVFDKGGHYFLNTIPSEVAEYLFKNNNIK